jgi:hypothetical protein
MQYIKSFGIGVLACLALCGSAQAESGKLLLTGGVSTVDGAAGGGISPWALVGTYATENQIGYSAYLTNLTTQDYGLVGYGVAAAFNNRVEVSLSQQNFDASPATALNPLGFSVTAGQHILLNTVGVKVRVLGDAVLDSDTWVPQVAVGALYKQVDSGTIKPILQFLGAKSEGAEYYISASKLLLAQSVLLNGTLRYTNANQGGLLGFGASKPGTDDASWQPEVSVAYLFSKNLAAGIEYRSNPNNLETLGRAAGLGNALAADNWQDIFVAWAPNKHVSLTAAYADLGRVLPGITKNHDQNGLYLSVQVAY